VSDSRNPFVCGWYTRPLRPTNEQATALAMTLGAARFAYNQTLVRFDEMREIHLSDRTAPRPTLVLLSREAREAAQDYPWMPQVCAAVLHEAVDDAVRNMQLYFTGRTFRRPSLRSNDNDTARFTARHFLISENRIRLAKVGWIKMGGENPWPDGMPVHATVDRWNGLWWSVDIHILLLSRPIREGAVTDRIV